jgi:hypothetical protein
MSGVDPPGKPTKIFTGRLGHIVLLVDLSCDQAAWGASPSTLLDTIKETKDGIHKEIKLALFKNMILIPMERVSPNKHLGQEAAHAKH